MGEDEDDVEMEDAEAAGTANETAEVFSRVWVRRKSIDQEMTKEEIAAESADLAPELAWGLVAR